MSISMPYMLYQLHSQAQAGTIGQLCMRWSCRYISQAELASVSSYMRGRLTIEAVNAALDDAASYGEGNHRLMAAARSNSVKPADRKRATTLLHCIAVCSTMQAPPHYIHTGTGQQASFLTTMHTPSQC